jgi:hypothetical protein
MPVRKKRITPKTEPVLATLVHQFKNRFLRETLSSLPI